MSERQLAAFAGQVDWHIAPVTRSLVLRGLDRESGEPLEVSFNQGQCALDGVALADIDVIELPGGLAIGWRLQSDKRQLVVQAHAVQVHIAAGRRIFAAIPGARLTLANRAGWAALLTLLRLPGGARLIRWVRSR